MTPFVTGFGIVMPIAILSPYYCIQFFGVKNKLLKFFFGVQSVTTFFRCSEGMTLIGWLWISSHLLFKPSYPWSLPFSFLEISIAMFGFLPEYAQDSLFNMLVYNLFPVEIKYDANGPLVRHFSFFSFLLQQILFLNLFAKSEIYLDPDVALRKKVCIVSLPTGRIFFTSFGVWLWTLCSRKGSVSIGCWTAREQCISGAWVSISSRLFAIIPSFRNCHFHACAVLFQMYLTTHGYGIFTVTSLCGVQQEPIMLNPIFESTSPSDFWGRRWNMVVHGMLKRWGSLVHETYSFRCVHSCLVYIGEMILFEEEYTSLYGQNIRDWWHPLRLSLLVGYFTSGYYQVSTIPYLNIWFSQCPSLLRLECQSLYALGKY